jgi:nickel transport protein
MPAQVGRTDQEGRALFVPGAIKRWRLKAYTADGHGVDIRFDAPALGTRQGAGPSAVSDSAPNRISLLLFGLSLLLAGFGAYQLWLRKKS